MIKLNNQASFLIMNRIDRSHSSGKSPVQIIDLSTCIVEQSPRSKPMFHHPLTHQAIYKAQRTYNTPTITMGVKPPLHPKALSYQTGQFRNTQPIPSMSHKMTQQRSSSQPIPIPQPSVPYMMTQQRNSTIQSAHRNDPSLGPFQMNTLPIYYELANEERDRQMNNRFIDEGAELHSLALPWDGQSDLNPFAHDEFIFTME